VDGLDWRSFNEIFLAKRRVKAFVFNFDVMATDQPLAVCCKLLPFFLEKVLKRKKRQLGSIH